MSILFLKFKQFNSLGQLGSYFKRAGIIGLIKAGLAFPAAYGKLQ